MTTTNPRYVGNPRSAKHLLLSLSMVALLAVPSVVGLGAGVSEAAHLNPEVVTTIPMPAGWAVSSVAVNPDTNMIYASAGTSAWVNNAIFVIDGATDTVITSVPTGRATQGIDVNPVTNRIYGVNVNDRTVTVVDGSTNTVVATIPGFGSKPRWLTVNPATNLVYVGNQGNGGGTTVSVVDGVTNTIVATIGGFSSPDGVAVNPVTNTLYVTNNVIDTVSVIDGATNGLLATIPVGDRPMELGVNAATNRIYVSNNADGTVSVIDGVTNTVIATVPVGANPRDVGINPITNHMYVSNWGANTVSVINGDTNLVVETIPVGFHPYGVDVNPVTDRVYVGEEGFGRNGHVSVIADVLVEVEIDIKPGSDPNSINTKSKGVIPVAILGSDTLEVAEVDTGSVGFGPNRATPKHPGGHLEDVNVDGHRDLVFHFPTQETGLVKGDTEACLSGLTLGGIPIHGCDAVNIRK